MALNAETSVRTELFPRFGVELDDATVAGGELAPDWINLRHDPGRRRQVIQHLCDLAYLPSANGAVEDEDLRAALAEFYLESSSFFNQFDRVSSGGTVAQAPRLEPDAVFRAAMVDPLRVSYSRLRVLQELTGFDGILRLRAMPNRNERSLRARVLRFRLRTFNFLDAGGPLFDEAAQGALAQFRALLSLTGSGPGEAQRAADLLGDVNALFSRFGELFGKRDLLAEVDRREGRAMRGHFRRRGRRPRRSSAKARLRDLAEDPMNLFGLELLQVLLWVDGYYEGTIDLDWGPLSVEALEAAVDQEALDRKRLLRKEKGFWRMDYHYAMARLLELAGEDEDVYVQQDAVLDGLERAIEESPDLDSWVDLEDRAAARDATVRENSERRQYFGIGALVRALRKVAQWVKNAFSRFLEWLRKLVGPVLQFIRFIGKGLRRALGYAALALRRLYHFVTGKPIVTRQEEPPGLVLTKPDLDGDSLAFTLGEASAELVASHHLAILRMNRALGVVLGVAVEVAKLFATGPIGWMAAARAIFRIVRDHLDDGKRDRLAGAMLWS